MKSFVVALKRCQGFYKTTITIGKEMTILVFDQPTDRATVVKDTIKVVEDEMLKNPLAIRFLVLWIMVHMAMTDSVAAALS